MEHSRFSAAGIDRWARQHPERLDLGLTGVVWLVCGLGSGAFAGLVGLVLGSVTILPLAVRRRYPVAVLSGTVGLFAVQLAVVPIPLPANVAQAVVVYTVAAHVASFRVRLFAVGAAVVGSFLGGLRWCTPPGYLKAALGTGAFLSVLAVLVWAIGNLVRGREANVRALHEARARLEESRLERARFAVQQERVAAAREIHDIVAHSLTVVIVQADGGEYAAMHAHPWSREDAGAVLATIGRTARSALSEVRGVIDMLRDTDTGTTVGKTPAVDLAELDRLVDAVRAAGLPVGVQAEPVVFDQVPTVVRFTVLRVVQEALTNVLKHAGTCARAQVLVQQRDGAVTVRIEDDGSGGALVDGATARGGSGPGHGLGGMQERVSTLGGVLTAGPRPGCGFVVEATIPVVRERGGR